MRYAHPGSPGALVTFQLAYGNYIDGKFIEPLNGQYFMNTSPVNGSDIAHFPRSDARDIDLALDAAHRAAEAWGKPRYKPDPTCCFRWLTALMPTWKSWPWRKAGITANRFGKRSMPICPWPPTIFATSRDACVRKRAAPARSMRKPWPITFMSRWA